MAEIRSTKDGYDFDKDIVVCQICGMVMNNNDEFVLCPDCITPFHTSCWNNRGGCGNPKCESYVEKTEKNDTLQGRIVSAINEKAKKSLEAGEFENASALYKKALGYDLSNEEALIGTLLAEICVTSLENLFLLNVEFERFPAYEAIQNRLSNKTKSLLENEIALRKERKRLEEEKQEKENKDSQADTPSQKPKVNTRLIALISAILAILISVSIVIGVSLSMQGSSDDDPPVEYSHLDYEEVDGGIRIVGLTDKTLEEVIIPNEIGGLPVTVIGSSAFYNCTSLTSATIGDSITEIGSDAFYGCTSLTSVTIGDSITEIGSNAFYGCNNIRVVEAPTTALYAIPKDNLQTVVINGGEAIEWNAFYGCTGLTSIEIPNSVTSIGNFAFSGCTGLTSIEIPNSVTTIGGFAFEGCTGLTSIEIPNSVTIIGSYAFSCCTGLTIYCEAESQPSGWDEGWNPSDRPVVWGNKRAYNNVIWKTTENGDVKIVGSVEGTTQLIIPETINGIKVVEISDSAFSGCTGLTSIEIPNSVTTIGGFAFARCTGLTSMEIPNSVTTIGGSAFGGCTRLTSIEIPNSVTTIGSYTFSGCTELTSIEIPNSVTAIGDYAFYNCTSLASIVIPTGVKIIVGHVFEGCTGLTSIEIPNSVTSIGDYAFYNCTGLTSIVIPNSVTYIGAGAFSCCTGFTSIEIPNSVTTIGQYAFSGCTGLTSITIPNSVTTIVQYAFSGCTGLTIYCEAESKPNGWYYNWNSSNCPVVWGHKEN